MRFGMIPLFAVLVLAAEEPGGPGTVSGLEFDGLIEAYRVVKVSASADGLLEAVNVDRGDLVEKGQVIATLESSVERTTLEIARARAEAVGEMNRQQANLEYSSVKLARDEDLYQKGVISEEGIAESQRDKLVAQAGLLEANENMRLARLDRDRAAAMLALRTVRSPLTGVVVDRLLSPGELVTQLREAQIVEIAQIDPLNVEVILPVAMLGSVSVGMKAEARPESPLDGVYTAQVTVVDRVVDAASGTFRVRLELPNKDNRLPAGLKCKVRFLSP